MYLSEIQSIIDKVVQIATEQAMNGHPLRRIRFIPAQRATDNHAYSLELCPEPSPGSMPRRRWRAMLPW